MATRNRKLEQYFTPERFVTALFSELPYNWLGLHIVEPCAGDGSICDRLPPGARYTTSDIDPTLGHTVLDATDPGAWFLLAERCPIDWVITNPPFSKAMSILENAYLHARSGVAFLVRLSFLEPTFARQDWLRAHPPTRIIVLPRHSFTGDGKSDMVTCAWVIWEKFPPTIHCPISFLMKEKRGRK